MLPGAASLRSIESSFEAHGTGQNGCDGRSTAAIAPSECPNLTLCPPLTERSCCILLLLSIRRLRPGMRSATYACWQGQGMPAGGGVLCTAQQRNRYFICFMPKVSTPKRFAYLHCPHRVCTWDFLSRVLLCMVLGKLRVLLVTSFTAPTMKDTSSYILRCSLTPPYRLCRWHRSKGVILGSFCWIP